MGEHTVKSTPEAGTVKLNTAFWKIAERCAKDTLPVQFSYMNNYAFSLSSVCYRSAGSID